MDFPLLAGSGNWHPATSSELSKKLIIAINRIVATQLLLSTDWLAAISYLQQVPHLNG
jgi:hypothetical protein